MQVSQFSFGEMPAELILEMAKFATTTKQEFATLRSVNKRLNQIVTEFLIQEATQEKKSMIERGLENFCAKNLTQQMKEHGKFIEAYRVLISLNPPSEMTNADMFFMLGMLNAISEKTTLSVFHPNQLISSFANGVRG